MTQTCTADNVPPCQYPHCSKAGEYSVIVAERAIRYYCNFHAKQMILAGAIAVCFPPKETKP